MISKSIKIFAFFPSCIAISLAHAQYLDNVEKPLFERLDDSGRLDRSSLNEQQHRPDPFSDKSLVAIDSSLPSEDSALAKIVKDPTMVKKDYLISHPEFFQELLGVLLKTGDAEGLRELLALYRNMPNQDPSVYDWGNAVIAMNEGNFAKATDLYRTLASNLPENKLIRFQMALALMQDQQFIAAKDQLERLRSTASPQDLEKIDKYINYIDSRDKWSFSGGVNFLHNPNINGAPPEGTELTFPNGATVKSSSKPISANGISYDVGASKRWALADRWYASLDTGGFGSYYFGHRNYNDFTARLGVGIGYRTATTDVELQPSFQYRWYGLGSNGDGSLAKYAATPAISLNLRQFLSPKIRYQGSLRYSYDKFVDAYDYQGGKTISLSNTILYTRNQNQFFYGGIDLIDKDAKDPSSAYRRIGGRLGWGQEWPKGISTRANVGYARRSYDAPDFFNITRKSNELNAGLSVWHRDVHFWDVTPKFNLNYSKVSGNHPFYDTNDLNFSIDFSKTF